MKPKNCGEQVVELLLAETSYSEIALKLGISKSTISYHAKRIGVSKPQHRIDWGAVREAYAGGASYAECCRIFNTTSATLWKASIRGEFTPRPTGGIARKKSLQEAIESYTGVRGSGARQKIRQKIIETGIIDYRCAVCGIVEWQGKPLTLRLDHIDGDGGNHAIENLRFICSNCDSQQDTYCSKNRGRYARLAQSVGGAPLRTATVMSSNLSPSTNTDG